MRRRTSHVAADIVFYMGLTLVALGVFDLLQNHGMYQRAVRMGETFKREVDVELEQRVEHSREDVRSGNRCMSTRAGRELVADSLGKLSLRESWSRIPKG